MTKSTKWHVRPAKTQISQGIRRVWSEPSLCAQWVAKDPRFLRADSGDWSDWADAQADLSLCWAHMSFCWVCHEVAHMSVSCKTDTIHCWFHWPLQFIGQLINADCSVNTVCLHWRHTCWWSVFGRILSKYQWTLPRIKWSNRYYPGKYFFEKYTGVCDCCPVTHTVTNALENSVSPLSIWKWKL